MSSIYREVTIDAPVDQVWDAVRDLGHAHQRLFPGVLTAVREEPGARVVTFADGRELRERILAVDDAHRRVSWTATGGPLVHHSASMQVSGGPDGRSHIVWITDVLPDEAAPMIAAIVDRGAEALTRTLGTAS
jgi:hypothetical protein